VHASAVDGFIAPTPPSISKSFFAAASRHRTVKPEIKVPGTVSREPSETAKFGAWHGPGTEFFTEFFSVSRTR
jgi:hypothetical protein